jgi:hypothetical protein
MATVRVSQVAGHPDDAAWSQTVVYPRAQSNAWQVLDGEGLMLLVLTVRNGSEERAREAGNQLIDQFEKRVDQEGIADVFGDIQGQRWELPQSIELMAVWLTPEGKAKVLGLGGGRVMIQRGGEVGLVFSLDREESRGIQGEWRPMDRWLVGTGGLVDEMSEQLTKEVLIELADDEAGEELITRVHGAEQNSLAAGVLVVFGENEEADEKTSQEVAGEPEQTGVKKPQWKPRIYLKSPLGGRRRAAMIGVVLLILLVISIGFGWYRREQQAWVSAYEALESSVNQKLESAITQASENPLAAKEVVVQAQQLITDSKEQFAEHEVYGPRVVELEEKAKQVYEQVSGEQALSDAPVWYELSLLREGMYGERMVRTGDFVVVLDASQGLVGRIELQNKSAELVGGGDLLGGSKLVAASGDRAVVLSNSGMVDLLMERKTSAVLVEPEAVWQQPVGIGLFAGNVYLGDAGANEIWRYPGLSAGVGERQRWLGAGVTPDLSGATDMVIDGDIWIAFTDGTIEQYRRGARENFRITGLEQPLGEVAAIDTNEETELVYILDRTNNRVVVVNKTGEYQQQVLWDGISASTDLVGYEEERLVLVLSGTSIYSLPLK